EKKTDTPKNSHTYTKMGSYIMQISADLSQTGIPNSLPQVVQTTLVHILPTKDYKLPEPVIKINGQIVPESNLNLGNSLEASSSGSGIFGLLARSKSGLEFDFNKRLSFDASASKAPSSKIIQYQWDFSQGDVVKSKNTSIKYKLPLYFAQVILRVKDENGFIAEAAVDLRNSGKNEPTGFTIEDYLTPTSILIASQVLVLAGVVVWFVKFRKRKQSS